MYKCGRKDIGGARLLRVVNVTRCLHPIKVQGRFSGGCEGGGGYDFLVENYQSGGHTLAGPRLFTIELFFFFAFYLYNIEYIAKNANAFFRVCVLWEITDKC